MPVVMLIVFSIEKITKTRK